MSLELLPDSRSRSKLEGRWGPLRLPSGRITRVWWVPVYCMSCHAPFGEVPDETVTWTGWLCNDCVNKHGHIDGTWIEPEVDYWRRVLAEMDEKHGRMLNAEEMREVETANTSPLAALLREGRKLLGRYWT